MSADAAEDGGGVGGPLAGLRVVELTQMVAGPLCGRLLASLGADVLKVEPPGGEPASRLPPLVDSTSTLYRYANADKRVVHWDLKDAASRARLAEEVEAADVLVDNLTPRALDRMGIPEEPAGPRDRPGIRCSIRATSEGGRRGVDSTAQAMTGMMWLLGDASAPRRLSLPAVDVLTGTLAALEVTAGVAAGRHRTGWTSIVSMTSVAAFLQGPTLLAAALGVPIEPLAGGSPHVAPGAPFRVSDGHVAISVLDEGRWMALCRVAGVDAGFAERFREWSTRMAAESEVHAAVQELLAGRSADELIAALEAEGVPCALVIDYAAALADPEVVGSLRLDGGIANAAVVAPIGDRPSDD
jgi:crotonobetainyl-CoA:carnitine CoA-transferase CaiB-like acyl-CoA transferase